MCLCLPSVALAKEGGSKKKEKTQMKKLITICIVSMLVFFVITSTANAAVIYKTHLASGDTSAVSYGAGDSDWPTPHMAASYNPPAVKTSFLPTDDIWVAAELDLTQLNSATDDAINPGFFDFSMNFYDPSHTLRCAIDDDSSYSWATIDAWRVAGYTSLDIWSADESVTPTLSLKDQVTGSLDPGLWTVEVYVEGGNLNTGSFTVVPEPATIAILGLGALSLIRRKR